MIIFSPLSGRLGIGHIFRTDGDRCLLFMSMWIGRKTNQSTYIFRAFSNSLNLTKLFNNLNTMIKPIKHRVLVYLKHWIEILHFLTLQKSKFLAGNVYEYSRKMCCLKSCNCWKSDYLGISRAQKTDDYSSYCIT